MKRLKAWWLCLTQLGDRDPTAAYDSQRVLREMGPPAVGALAWALRWWNRRARARAAEILGAIGDARAVGPLLRALNDPDSEVQRAAATSLGSFTDDRAVDPLIVKLDDPDADVRSAACSALGGVGSERAVQPLADRVSQGDFRWAVCTVESLCRIPGKRAAEAALRIASPFRHGTRAVSLVYTVAARLVRDGDPRGRPLLLGIVLYNADSKDEFRLLFPNGAQGASPLEKAVYFLRTCNSGNLRHNEPDYRARQRCDPGVIETLIGCLGHDSPWLRTHAALGLGVLGATEASKPLIEALERAVGSKEPDEAMVWATSRALGNISAREAVGPLVSVLERCKGAGVEGAVWALGQLRAKRAVPALIRALENFNREMAKGNVGRITVSGQTLAECLGKIGDPAAIPALQKTWTVALAGKDYGFKFWTADALYKLGVREGVEPWLKDALSKGS